MPSLGFYFSLLCDDEVGDGKRHFRQDPQLDTERSNVIIIFKGSFNPPHKGHLAVLYHAYEQLAEELNIVAALIRPHSDRSLQSKRQRRRKTENKCIPLNDRVRLWKEDPHFPAWACGSLEVRSSAFQKQLKALALLDGCKIRFAYLFGPDAVLSQEHLEHSGKMIIGSDVAREAIYEGHHGFRSICQSNVMSNWYVDVGRLGMKGLGEPQTQESIAADEEDAQGPKPKTRNIIANLSLSLSQESSKPAGTPIDELVLLDKDKQMSKTSGAAGPLAPQLLRLSSPNSVIVCWCKEMSPRRSLRLLNSTPEQHGPFRGISSSAIQEKMHELDGLELKSALDSAALSPNLLWDILHHNDH